MKLDEFVNILYTNKKMDVPGTLQGTEPYPNAYQVYHKEGLLSQQSSVVPNAPLLYEQQVLLSKLRQGGASAGNVDNNNKGRHHNAPPSPKHFPHDSLDSASQDTDDSKSEV